MSSHAASIQEQGFTTTAPGKSNVRWFVCALLFAATTINYMDRSVFSFIEPLLHNVPFMGWDPLADKFHQTAFDNNYGNVIICFQIAYGIGYIFAGWVIDKVGTKAGYAIAIAIWALSSMSHSLVTSVAGFCIARIFLGLGESGNFPAGVKACSEWFPVEERAKAVGIFNSGTCAAFFLAPLLIGWASGHFGWRAAFIATGSLGVLWLIVWLIFPYERLRAVSSQTQANLKAALASKTRNGGKIPMSELLRRPGTYAYAIGKILIDGIWWFYLFYLPQFLNRNYGLDLKHAYPYIVTVYVASTIGSIFGGTLSGWLMSRGHTVNSGRKLAMLLMAILVLPLVFVPHMGVLFPANPWPATLILALATAAHQGFSANLFAAPADMVPSSAVSTVVGIGGAAGAAGGAAFTWIVKRSFSLHPLLIFSIAASVYLIALALFHLLVPRLGVVQNEAEPV